MNSNEPIHSFFSDKPNDDAHTKAYQQGLNDGIRIGREQGIRMLNEYLIHLGSIIGEAKILEIREKIRKIDES